MNPKLLIGLFALTALTALAACGSKTDPTSDYSDVKDSVPVYDGNPHAQGVLPGDLFRAEIQGAMNFIEGQEASYPVKIVSMLNGVTYDLTATGLPTGIQLQKVDQNNYVIKGTVPYGTTSAGQKGESAPIKISAINIAGDQGQSRFLNGSLLHAWDTSVSLYATDKYPMVESPSISGLQVTEGADLPISIIVDDVGSVGSAVPTGYFSFQDDLVSGEVAFVSPDKNLHMNSKPEILGVGRFKFTGVLKTKGIQLPAGKSKVTVRFAVAFRSILSNLISADEFVDVKINRAAPAPVVQPVVPATDASPIAKPEVAKPAAKPTPKPTPKPAAKK